ncbi:MAG: tail protein X [Candidatus Accumulibacter sp.]|jgi:phage tail protein X|nr:tail protein X [Accumulibacter sp.]
MTVTVTARSGETLDYLCWRAFRQTAGITEAALELNPGIAMSAILPEGRAVTLPDRPPALVRELIQLWD